jgi:hypothetical protein
MFLTAGSGLMNLSIGSHGHDQKDGQSYRQRWIVAANFLDQPIFATFLLDSQSYLLIGYHKLIREINMTASAVVRDNLTWEYGAWDYLQWKFKGLAKISGNKPVAIRFASMPE